MQILFKKGLNSIQINTIQINTKYKSLESHGITGVGVPSVEMSLISIWMLSASFPSRYFRTIPATILPIWSARSLLFLESPAFGRLIRRGERLRRAKAGALPSWCGGCCGGGGRRFGVLLGFIRNGEDTWTILKLLNYWEGMGFGQLSKSW